MINYKEDICKNKYLLSLLLFDSNNLLYWFNQKVNLKEVLKDNYINFKMNCIMNKIIIKEEMSLETYIYLNSLKDTNYSYLINIHKELIKRNRLNRPILNGIKKIDFDTEIGDKLFELFCIKKDSIIKISNDIEYFQTNRFYKGILSSLEFQDGTKIINMKNVSPMNDITIKVPSSVNRLNLNFNGKISKIIIDNYRFSPLLALNSFFINELVEKYYKDISKNDDIFIIGPVNNNSINLIGIYKEKEFSTSLNSEYVDVKSEENVILEQNKIIKRKKHEIEKEFSNDNYITYINMFKEKPKGVPRWVKIK